MERFILSFIQHVFTFVVSLIISGIVSLVTGGILHVVWGYLAPKYFGFLPPADLNISYWDSVVIAYFLTFIGDLIFKKSE